MKARFCTYLIICFCFSKLFSQEPRLSHLVDKNGIVSEENVYQFSHYEEGVSKALSLLTIGNDLYTLQVLNFTVNNIALGINTRLEEELPYNANSYDYSGFYYLDFGCSYTIGNFDLGFSIDNLLNLNSKDFSIDPNLETSDGITNAFYLSHESDTLMSLAVAYNF